MKTWFNVPRLPPKGHGHLAKCNCLDVCGMSFGGHSPRWRDYTRLTSREPSCELEENYEQQGEPYQQKTLRPMVEFFKC